MLEKATFLLGIAMYKSTLHPLQYHQNQNCVMISPFKSNDVPCANDIGVSVKKYADAGLTISSYDYDPDDHYAKLGMEMQRYLADQCTREQLAEAIQNYWANVTPVQH